MRPCSQKCRMNAYILLPHSHMTFNVGYVYRDMFVENFELNGYKPDIECEYGTDAMDD